MKKVIYAGPFDTYGVYQGGISVVVNDAYEAYTKKSRLNFKLLPFNTCQIQRSMNKQGKISIENIKNTLLIKRKLEESVKKQECCAIYYNTSAGIPLLKDIAVLYFVKMRTKAKTIVHIHYANSNEILPANFILRKLSIFLLNGMNHIVFLSKNTENDMKRLISKKVKTTVLYNFHNYNISQDVITKKIERIKADNALNIMFLGSICMRKGILDLLEALKQCTGHYKLHICGEITDDAITEEYKKLIGEEEDNLIIEHGYVRGEEKEQLLLESDILVLPSYGEGFPIVLLEGIANGCALVASNVGTTKEVFTSSNGYFFKPGDIESIVKAINELRDKDKLVSICANNYKCSSNYSVQNFIDGMSKIIEEDIY